MPKQRKKDLAEIESSDPLREPNWRMQRALAIVNTANCNTKLEDALIKECVHNLKLRDRTRECKSYRSVAESPFSVIEHVIELYTNQHFRPLRVEVEARILAGQGDHEIAEATGLPAFMVRLYEQTCFDIRDRLRFIDYILCWVLGTDFGKHPYQLKLERQLKYFAYLGGPQVLDMMLFCVRATGTNRQRLLASLATSMNVLIPKRDDIDSETCVLLFRDFANSLKGIVNSTDQAQARKAS